MHRFDSFTGVNTSNYHGHIKPSPQAVLFRTHLLHLLSSPLHVTRQVIKKNEKKIPADAICSVSCHKSRETTHTHTFAQL